MNSFFEKIRQSRFIQVPIQAGRNISGQWRPLFYLLILVQICALAYVIHFRFFSYTSPGNLVWVEIPDSRKGVYSTASATVLSNKWRVVELQITAVGHKGDHELANLLKIGNVAFVPRKFILSRESGRAREKSRFDVKAEIHRYIELYDAGYASKDLLLLSLIEDALDADYSEGVEALELIKINNQYRHRDAHNNLNQFGEWLDSISAYASRNELRFDCKGDSNNLFGRKYQIELKHRVFAEILRDIYLSINRTIAVADIETLVSSLPNIKQFTGDLSSLCKTAVPQEALSFSDTLNSKVAELVQSRFKHSLLSRGSIYESKDDADRMFFRDKMLIKRIDRYFDFEIETKVFKDQYYYSQISIEGIAAEETTHYQKIVGLVDAVDEPNLIEVRKELSAFLKKYPHGSFATEVLRKIEDVDKQIDVLTNRLSNRINELLAEGKSYSGKTETDSKTEKFTFRITNHDIDGQAFKGTINWQGAYQSALVNGGYTYRGVEVEINFKDIAITGNGPMKEKNIYQMSLSDDDGSVFKGERVYGQKAGRFSFSLAASNKDK